MTFQRGRSALWLAVVLSIATAGGACRGAGSVSESPRDADVPQPVPTATNPDAHPLVVVLGDSLTAGLGLLEAQAFPALLQQRIDDAGYGYQVENAGVSGDTSAGGLRRLDWSLAPGTRVLVLALGANDGLRGLSVAEMKRNLTEIIDRAQQRGVVVILAGMEAPPNYGQEYAAAFRNAFREIAQEKRVRFIPFLLDGVAGHPDLNQRDGIHPNPQGAAIVADTVWAALQPVLDALPGPPGS